MYLPDNLSFLPSVGYLTAAIVLFSVGAYAYHIFLQSDFMQVPGSEWSNAEGFTQEEFVWYAVGTYFLPIGLVSFLIFTVQFFRLNSVSTAIKLFISYCILGLTLWAIVQSYGLAGNLLDCGIFCVGASTKSDSTEKSGGETFVGLVYFFVCLIIAIFYFTLCLLLHVQWSKERSLTNGLTASLSDSGGLSLHDPDGLASARKPLMDTDAYSSPHKGRPLERGKFPSNRTGSTHSNGSVMYDHLNTSSTVGRGVVQLVFVFLVILPLLIFAVVALPTGWLGFNKSSVRSYEHLRPAQGYGRYWPVEVGDNLVLKIFPDVLIYYTSLYIVVGVALLAQLYPALGRYLYRRPRSKVFQGLSIGETMLLFSIGFMIVGQFFYWFYDHAWQMYPRDSYSNEELAARALGQTSNILCGLLVLPISRNSIWSIVFGVSWEAMVMWHTYLGGAFMVSVLLHAFVWWKVFDQQGTFPHDIFAVPMTFHGDNFTNPLASLTTFIMMILIGGGAYYTVRRKYYEIFYYSHHFVVVIFALILWHATMSWYYITAGLILWAIDHIIRVSRSVGNRVELQGLSVVGSGNVLVLSYTVEEASKTLSSAAISLAGKSSVTEVSRPLCHDMGQFCFLNVPALSSLEWHPFTISSAPGDAVTTNHIKSMGDQQWTGRFLSLVREILESDDERETGRSSLLSRLSLQSLVVNVDGPYGVPIPIERYTHVCLIAGGIGITPVHSYVRHIYLTLKATRRNVTGMVDDEPINEATENDYSEGERMGRFSHLKRVRMIWSVRTDVESSMFDDTFDMIQKDDLDGLFQCTVYVTQSSSSYDNSNGHNVNAIAGYQDSGKQFGRPNLEKELNSLSYHGSNAIVFACGPSRLVEELSDLTKAMEIDFRHETFEL